MPRVKLESEGPETAVGDTINARGTTNVGGKTDDADAKALPALETTPISVAFACRAVALAGFSGLIQQTLGFLSSG